MRRNPYIGRSQQVCSPETIIQLGKPEEHTRYRDGDTGDIIETIMAMDAESSRWIRDDMAAECLRGDTERDTLRNVWQFVKSNNTYRPDPSGHEQVKSPRALFTTRTGDCKSYSIAEAALLRALGIPYKYRFASYDNGDFTHVYVMARTREGWLPLDAVHKKPLEEVPYRRHKDISPTAINGIGITTPRPAPVDWKTIGLWAFIIYLLTR